MFSFVRVTGFIIAAIAAIAAYTTSENAAQVEAVSNLAQVAVVQEMTLAGDGKFPEQIGSLEDSICADDIAEVFGDICTGDGLGLFNPVPLDFTISYAVNEDRTHYIAAELLKNGSVLVVSDTVTAPVQCAQLTYECVAQVTDDEQLRNAVPNWQNI